MKKRWKSLLLPGIVVLVIALLVVYSSTRPTLVDTGAVHRGGIRSFVEEEGETRVLERYVLSMPVDGRLLRVEKEERDPVAAEEVLFEVDPLALESRLRQSEARIAALRAQLAGVDRRRPKASELERSRLEEQAARDQVEVADGEMQATEAAAVQARRDAKRARDLSGDGTITEAEREEAELAETRAEESLRARRSQRKIQELQTRIAELGTKILAETAHDLDWEEDLYRSQVEEVEAALALARDDLRRAQVASPVQGMVLERHQESEAVLAAGTPVLTVGSLGAIEVEADFLSEDAARMEPGMRAEIYGRALGDRVVAARIRLIHPSAFEEVSSLGVEQQRVTVLLTPEGDGFGIGDRYRVEVRVIFDEKPDVLLVPESALFRVGEEWRVFAVERGRAVETTVATGLRNGLEREVLSGLGAGAEVVLHPDAELEDRARIAAR